VAVASVNVKVQRCEKNFEDFLFSLLKARRNSLKKVMWKQTLDYKKTKKIVPNNSPGTSKVN